MDRSRRRARQQSNRRRARKQSNQASASAPLSCKIFTLEELRSITNDFSEENCLVEDANTGGTYSGLLADGSKVAVKRLKRSSIQTEKKFYSAFGRIETISHPNLMDEIGGFHDDCYRYIVYEFIGNRSLDRWLHDIPMGGTSLDWAMRMKVATTLAQGIAFLHETAGTEVVDVDIRASNVFLDEDFGAHLMGVGFVPWDWLDESARMAGSHEHQAPEFLYRFEVSTECDVYSFGVLLLELVSGRRPVVKFNEYGGWENILVWASPLVDAERYLEILDPLISSSSKVPEVGVIEDVVHLAYACARHVPSMRPIMSDVVHQLQHLPM